MSVKPPVALATLALVAAVAFSTARPAAAQTDTTQASAGAATDAHWASKRQWMSFRVGYARSSVTGAANGSFGGGLGYSRMLSRWKLYRWTLFKQFSLGGYVHFEELGRFAEATEYEIPVTLEFARHFRWSEGLHPYVGVGGGAFYRKLYRTGGDLGRVEPGYYLLLGTNVPINASRLIGVDARVIRVNADNAGTNPVFGPGDEAATHWSIKLNYSLSY